MQTPRIQHATIVVERKLSAAPERVFKAFADPQLHRQWHVPGGDWIIADYEHDFRVGGRLFSSFGPPNDPKFWNEGRFLYIEPNTRIVSAGAMHVGTRTTTSTLCTIELFAEDGGTRLVLTDQSAFLAEGETSAGREQGWSQILDRLQALLIG